MSQSDPSSVAVYMEVSVMGESGGGVGDLEHIAICIAIGIILSWKDRVLTASGA